MSRTIRLGVIGGGQLGSLLCSAAKKLKVKTVVLSDDKEGPAQHFCDQFIYSKYDDNKKIIKLFVIGFIYATIITGILYYLIKFIAS